MAPLRRQRVGVVQTVEDLRVQEFIAQPPVEALRVPVLLRAARRDVQHLHARDPRQPRDRPRDELAAVAAPNVVRHAACAERPDEQVHDVLAGHAALDLQQHALTRELINHAQPLQRTIAIVAVVDEVHAPHVVLAPGPAPRDAVGRDACVYAASRAL